MPECLITTHVAAISHPALIAPVFVEYYRRYMRKEPLNYVIDFDSGY
jgi:phosphoglycerate dehydrogenase-like enzyme